MEEAPLLLPAPEPSLSSQFGSIAQAIVTVQQRLEESEHQEITETGQVLLGKRISNPQTEKPRPAVNPAASPSLAPKKLTTQPAAPLPNSVPVQRNKRLQEKATPVLGDAAAPLSGLSAMQTAEEPLLPPLQPTVQGQIEAHTTLNRERQAEARPPSQSAAEAATTASEAEKVNRDVSDGTKGGQRLATQQSLEELRQRAVAAVKARKAEAARSESGKTSPLPRSTRSGQQQNPEIEAASGRVSEQEQAQIRPSSTPSPLPGRDALGNAASASRGDAANEAAHTEHHGAANDAAEQRPARNFRQRKAASSRSGSLISSKPPEVSPGPQSRPSKAVLPHANIHQPPTKKQRMGVAPIPRGHLPLPPNFPLPVTPATAASPSPPERESPNMRKSQKRDRSPERRGSRARSHLNSSEGKAEHKQRVIERERERHRDREGRRQDHSRRKSATPRRALRHSSPSPHRRRGSRSRRTHSPEHDRRRKKVRSRSPSPFLAKPHSSARPSSGGDCFCIGMD